MTPAIVLNDIAAIARKVRDSNLWIAHGLRQTQSPNNHMRQYARLAVRIGQVDTVRGMLYRRMNKQTPRAQNLIAAALAVYDHELERIAEKQIE